MSPEKHIVVDLETFGLAPDSIILSIGAISNTGEKFYLELDWKEQQYFRKVDPSTCMWWGQQEQGLCPLGGSTLLYEALVEFSLWLPENKDDYFIWCRGLDMDIAMLKHAYGDLGLAVPWKYNNVRDVRTALHFVRKENLVEPEKKHHALYDAIADMRNLVNHGWIRLGEGVEGL